MGAFLAALEGYFGLGSSGPTVVIFRKVGRSGRGGWGVASAGQNSAHENTGTDTRERTLAVRGDGHTTFPPSARGGIFVRTLAATLRVPADGRGTGDGPTRARSCLGAAAGERDRRRRPNEARVRASGRKSGRKKGRDCGDDGGARVWVRGQRSFDSARREKAGNRDDKWNEIGPPSICPSPRGWRARARARAPAESKGKGKRGPEKKRKRRKRKRKTAKRWKKIGGVSGRGGRERRPQLKARPTPLFFRATCACGLVCVSAMPAEGGCDGQSEGRRAAGEGTRIPNSHGERCAACFGIALLSTCAMRCDVMRLHSRPHFPPPLTAILVIPPSIPHPFLLSASVAAILLFLSRSAFPANFTFRVAFSRRFSRKSGRPL